MQHHSRSDHEEYVATHPMIPASNPKLPAVEARPSRDEVARAAYFIYVEQGRPRGRDVQHWLEAEAMLADGSRGGLGSLAAV